jgi:hypothetical protein
VYVNCPVVSNPHSTYILQAQLDPWHLYDPKTLLHYITNRVKGFTEEMATKNTTPFLHRYLYRDYTPPCILSCFTTCVLYAGRTPANTTMVMRALHGSARGLVEAEAHRVTSTPVEKLARVQALFLYEIICLFDGDIALRAQGEKDMPLFNTWLGELCSIRDNLGDLARLEDASVRKQPPLEWEVCHCSSLYGIIYSLTRSLRVPEMDFRRESTQDHTYGLLGRRLIRTDEGPGGYR